MSGGTRPTTWRSLRTARLLSGACHQFCGCAMLDGGSPASLGLGERVAASVKVLMAVVSSLRQSGNIGDVRVGFCKFSSRLTAIALPGAPGTADHIKELRLAMRRLFCSSRDHWFWLSSGQIRA